MLTIARTGLDGLRSFFRNERGQDVFEYVLIIGIITVAVLVAVVTPVGTTMIDAIIDGTCAAIDAIDGVGGIVIGAGTCTP